MMASSTMRSDRLNESILLFLLCRVQRNQDMSTDVIRRKATNIVVVIRQNMLYITLLYYYYITITCYFVVQICSEKGHGDANPKKKMCWEKGNIAGYEHALAQNLGQVPLPVEVLMCDGDCSTDHANLLQCYSKSISNCMHSAAALTIPQIKLGVQKH